MSLRARLVLWALAVGLVETALIAASCSTTSKRPQPPTFTLTHTNTPIPTPTLVGGTATMTVPITATAPFTPTVTRTLTGTPAAPGVSYFQVGSIRIEANFCQGGPTVTWVDGYTFNTFLCDSQGTGNVASAAATGVAQVSGAAVNAQLTPDASSNDPHCRIWSRAHTSLNGFVPGPTFAVTPSDSFQLVVSQLTPSSTPFPPASVAVDFVAADLPHITTNLCVSPPGPNFVINWTPPSSGPSPDFYLVTVIEFLSGTTVWGPNAYYPGWNWAYISCGPTPAPPTPVPSPCIQSGNGYIISVTAVWHAGVHPNAPDTGSHAIVFTD